MKNILLLTTIFTLFTVVSVVTAFAGFPGKYPAAVSSAGMWRVPSATLPAFRALSSAARQPRHQKFREGELLVKFRKHATHGHKEQLHTRHGSQKLKEFTDLRLHHVRLRKGLTLDEARRLYQDDPDVEYAEPNYLATVQTVPNDPSFSELWGLQNTGQTGGVSGASIHAPEAWNLTTGSSSVVVAIIDSGIDYTHPDLIANVWRNPNEISGNGLDDDTNGYLDDVYGIDACNHDNDPFDDNGHGTHVAGTIGAVGNNGAGVVGVNWNVRLMACKAFDASGSGDYGAIIECLEYVRNQKARGVNIVATNNSWVGDADSQALHDAIAAQGDILFIAAAGNSNRNNDIKPTYPTAYNLPNIISVAATENDDTRVVFSNYGRRSVHLAAPGTGILSTLPAVNAFGLGGMYGTLSGTSMATPHVTGVAALIKAQQPTRPWWEVRNLILAGGDRVSSLADISMTGRRVNAAGSLTCTDRPVFFPVRSPQALTPGTPVTLSALSINCAGPTGPVTVTTSTGEVITLRDDGVSPDMVAGDGYFAGRWAPGVTREKLTFSSPAGSESVAVPPLVITTAIIPEGNTQAVYSQTVEAAGALPPYAWSVTAGALPPVITLDPASGTLSGQPLTPGSYTFTLKVTDAWQFSTTRELSIAVTTDPVTEQWVRTYDNGQRDSGDDVATDAEGNVYVAGYTGWTDGWWTGSYDYITIKYAPDGSRLWERTYPAGLTSIYMSTHHVSTDPAGNVAFSAQYTGDILTVKYDAAGIELWSRTYDGGGNEIATGIAADGSGNLLVAGDSNDGSQSTSLTIKYDPGGNVLWARKSDPTGGARGIAVDTAGNAYVAAYLNGNAHRVIKYDPAGNVLWDSSYAFNSFHWLAGVAVDGDGNAYVAGSRNDTWNAVLTKFDSTGTPLWSREYQGEASAVRTDGYGNVYLATLGYTYKLEPVNGDIIWRKWGGYGLALDGRGGTLLAGELWNGYDYDIFARKYVDYFITTPSLPIGYAGFAYGTTLGVSGGKASYQWTVASGALPAGLTLNAATGELSGTTSQEGVFPITFQVTDAGGLPLTRAMTLTVVALKVTTTALPPGKEMILYSQTLAVTGGQAPYHWEPAAGSLPPGITLDSVSGILSGLPSKAGMYAFTVQVTDANSRSALQELVITVADDVFTAWSENEAGGIAYGITRDNAGNLLVTGGGGSAGGTIIKYDSVGALLWKRTFSGYGYGVAVDAAGNVYVGGIRDWNNIITLKYDSAGNLLWERSTSYSSGGSSYNNAVALDQNGNVYVTGTVYNGTTYEFRTLKYDPAGNLLWSRGYSENSNFANTLAVDAAGNSYVSGTTIKMGTYSGTREDYQTVKYDPDGNLLWVRTFNRGTHDCEPMGSALGPDGSVVLAGTIKNGANNDVLVLKYDNAGNILWSRSFDAGHDEFATGVSVSADGTISVVGRAHNGTDFDYLVVQFDVSGTFLLARTYDGGWNDYGWGIVGDDGGNLYVTGGAYDGGNNSYYRTIRFTPLLLTPPSLPFATIGEAYSQTVAAPNAAAPVVWMKVAGALPPGLSLNGSTGEIAGTPTATGDFSFAVQATDAVGKKARKDLTITVNPAGIVTSTLPAATVGSAYSQGLVVTGRTAPYAWSVSSGSLPAGLSLESATGIISGTPVTTGSATFTVQVVDEYVATDFRPLALAVYNPLVVATTDLPAGQMQASYSTLFSATGGLSPYTWAIVGGRLPDGLTLSGSTGTITGTSYTWSVNDLRVQVKDAVGFTAERQLRLTVRLLPVRNKENNYYNYYSSVQNAYNNLYSSGTMELQAGEKSGGLVCDKNFTLTLKGGFDEMYQGSGEITTLVGNLIVTAGTLIVDGIAIR